MSDESASGRSMSAASTSEFGHESLTKIIEVFKSVLKRKRRKFIIGFFSSSLNTISFESFSVVRNYFAMKKFVSLSI